MGRNKLAMKKIENSTSRQQTYSKRKDSIVKKANELAVLCDTCCSFNVFSNRPIPNEQHFSQRLTQLKYESEMVEKIAIAESHEEKLNKLNQRLREARENIRYYEPQVEYINSVHEAVACQQFLMGAMGRIQQKQNSWVVKFSREMKMSRWLRSTQRMQLMDLHLQILIGIQ